MIAVREPSSIQELDPDVALRSGTLDATMLLIVWCLRNTFFPLLWVGLTVAFIAMQPEKVAEQLAGLESVGGFFRALLSPLVVVVLAIVVRVGASAFALALAFPFSAWIEPEEPARGRRSRGRIRVWWDRIHVSRAYRSLRWTWAVRDRAVKRLGGTGKKLALCDSALRWSNVPLVVVFVVTVIVVRS